MPLSKYECMDKDGLIIWMVCVGLVVVTSLSMLCFQYFVELKKPKQKKRKANNETLTFENISFSVKSSNGELFILQNISGCVQPGEICAIMGQSGAGYELFHFLLKY